MRYRIDFVVRFERIVDARDDATARRIADEIAQTDSSGGCHWNTIERLEVETVETVDD